MDGFRLVDRWSADFIIKHGATKCGPCRDGAAKQYLAFVPPQEGGYGSEPSCFRVEFYMNSCHVLTKNGACRMGGMRLNIWR